MFSTLCVKNEIFWDLVWNKNASTIIFINNGAQNNFIELPTIIGETQAGNIKVVLKQYKKMSSFTIKYIEICKSNSLCKEVINSIHMHCYFV